jgi:5-hydroxyisourate hydrolase
VVGVTLSTHVLDASLGVPAAGVPVTLYVCSGDGSWVPLAGGHTDRDGRLSAVGKAGAPLELRSGVHRIDFDTGSYFSATDQHGFYPQVSITFEVTDPQAHYHVPLLLSRFAYSTYRGS